MLNGMGAILTPVEISEIMPALMTGLVDGQENLLNNIIARKMYQVDKYVMMTSHMESVLGVFINEKTWQGLDVADRELMQGAMVEMAKRSLQWYRDSEAKEIEFLKSQGVTINDESKGLKIDEFRAGVQKQGNIDFPNWKEYLTQLSAIK